MAVSFTLTGKTRYRLQCRLFRDPLLIVQVEVHRTGTYQTWHNGWVDTETLNDFIWRDAKVEDLCHLKSFS